MLDQEARAWIDEALAMPEREKLLRVMRKLRRCEQAEPAERPQLEALLKLDGISTWMRRELIRLLYQLQDVAGAEDSSFLLSLRGEDEAWSFELGELMTRRELKDRSAGQAGWRAWIETLLEALAQEDVDEGLARIAFQLLGHEGALEAATPQMRADIAGMAALWLTRASDALLRQRASWLLLETGAGAHPYETTLVQLLSDEDAQIAAQAAQTLGRLKTVTEETIAALEVSLKHPYYAVRGYAAEALKHHPRPLSSSRLEALQTMLRADEPWERRMAVEALGRLAKGDEVEAALLCQALSDRDDHIAVSAMDALRAWEIDLSPYVSVLIEQLQHPLWRRRQNAACVLERAGELARSAIPTIVQGIRDSRWRVRRSFLMALMQIDPDDASVRQAFLDSLHDEEWQNRLWAAEALGRVREGAEICVAGLCQALHDPVWEVRHAAAISLTTLHRYAGGHIEQIAASLADEKVQVARVAAKTLSKMVSAYPHARQFLEDTAAHGADGIRQVCVGLLKALDRAQAAQQADAPSAS
ncbi:MAG: HEAT repeat domain-containing protein [Myxococcales bacterium]|nr:HEAT repeat domain-containing protein [Myxococcales bacterium]